jgi:hypothetical protein
MTNDKKLEGIAIFASVVSGDCNRCPVLDKCERDQLGKFPEDAACMIRKREYERIEREKMN